MEDLENPEITRIMRDGVPDPEEEYDPWDEQESYWEYKSPSWAED